TGKQERIDGAKTFLETYGNSGTSGDCSIGEGGLTSEQAQKIMDYYKNSETSDSIRTIFTKPGSSAAFFLDSAEALCGASDAPADKQDLMSRLANCTAFSTYFVAKYTDMNVDGWGTGKQKVGTLIDKNPGAQSGDTPKVFSVFSRQSGTMVCDEKTGEVCGHTGIVLGIDGDKVIIGEASCGSGVAGIQVRESTVTEMSGSDYVYMYTDGHVNQEEILSVVNG